MSITETRPETAPAPTADPTVEPAPPRGLAGWLSTSDHKRIGRSFIVTSLLFLLVGGVAGGVLSAERIDSGLEVLDSGVFEQVYTLHGVVAVLLFLVPLFLGLAIYVVPLQVGAADVAFPRAAATAYWVYLVSGLVLLASYAADGGPGGGDPTAVDLWILAMIAIDLATVLALVSVLTTVVGLRAPGLPLDQAPLFSWSMLVGGGLTLLAVPVMVANLILAYVSHHYGGEAALGVGPVSWFFSLPQVYVLAVPAAGIVAEIVPVFGRVRQARHGVMMGLLAAFGVLGFGAWAQAPRTFDDLLYVAVGVVIVLPVLALVAGWADTLRRGRPRLDSPLLFALGAAVMLLLAAVTGAAAVIDPLELQGTTWTVAQMHLTLFGAATLGGAAGLFYWGPKIWGARLAEGTGKAAFAALFLGGLLLALPDLVSGLVDDLAAGTPEFSTDGTEQLMNGLSAAGGALAILGALALVASVATVAFRAKGSVTVDDPWDGHTLEWATASPPPPGNFDRPLPELGSPSPLLDARPATTEATA